MSEVKTRRAALRDREVCGRILHDAFKHIADLHGFPPDFPSPEAALAVADSLLADCWGSVAEMDGRVVGSIFVRRGDSIVGVGPVTVDASVQQAGLGRRLMQAALEHARNAEGIRLVQDTFNATSMALYASLGFDAKEPLVLLAGVARSHPPSDIEIRPLRQDDVDACAALCRHVHGITRSGEVRLALERLRPFVAEREGRITAYATTLDFWAAGHGVAETERDLAALISGASKQGERPLSFLFPIRQAGLFRWCLGEGLLILKPMTLMAMGRYQEPRGCHFPSAAY